MKIGEFSRKFNITQSTVRYYVKQGLLIPESKNRQYIFTEKCIEDMKRIIRLKGMGLSVNLIHKFLSVYRISNLSVKEDREYIKALIVQYRSALVEDLTESEKKKHAVKDLDSDIWMGSLNDKKNDGNVMPLKLFAEVNNIGERKLRYYIEHKLLNPQKECGMFVFDDTCRKRLNMIQYLKFCEFTLEEIKQWLDDLDKTELLTEDEKKSIISYKTELIEQRKTKLISYIGKCEEEIIAIEGRKSVFGNQGCPVEMIKFICCPQCGRNLIYENVKIIGNSIQDGHCYCRCGYDADIKEGVMVVNGVLGGKRERKRVKAIHDGRDYYRQMVMSEISDIQRSHNWVMRKLKERDLSGKVIFENCVNVISFLLTGIEFLPEDAYYIILDSSLEAIKEIKKRIATFSKDFNILYIVDDSIEYPLKYGCVDYIIDYYSSEMFQLNGINSLGSIMLPYVRYDTDIIGVFTYIKNGSKTVGKLRKAFSVSIAAPMRLSLFKRYLSECGVMITEESSQNEVSDSGMQYYEKGEKMYEFWYHGKFTDKKVLCKSLQYADYTPL